MFKPNVRTPNKQDRQTVVSTFYQCDLGQKGYLDREDLKVAIVALFGYKPSKVEVHRILGNKNGLTVDAFTNIMLTKMSSSDEDDEIRSTFLAFDTNCNGFLTLNDLQRAISTTAPHLPKHSVESAFREMDRDGDGRVSYRDFEYMMKYDPDLHVG